MKVRASDVLLIAVGIVGAYLIGVGLSVLYFGRPMNLGRIMNRDGLLFILTGVAGILWADLQHTKIVMRRRVDQLERRAEIAEDGVNDIRESVKGLRSSHMALTHRVFTLEKPPVNRTETGIEPK